MHDFDPRVIGKRGKCSGVGVRRVWGVPAPRDVCWREFVVVRVTHSDLDLVGIGGGYCYNIYICGGGDNVECMLILRWGQLFCDKYKSVLIDIEPNHWRHAIDVRNE